MTETLDTIRAEIVARREEAVEDMRDAHEGIKLADVELDAHDRAVAAMQIAGAYARDGHAVPTPPRERHSVQRVVMAAIASGPAGSLWTEQGLIGLTGLPAASVHEFLLRAVRQGKLIVEGGVYSLPASGGQQRDVAQERAREAGDEG